MRAFSNSSQPVDSSIDSSIDQPISLGVSLLQSILQPDHELHIITDEEKLAQKVAAVRLSRSINTHTQKYWTNQVEQKSSNLQLLTNIHESWKYVDSQDDSPNDAFSESARLTLSSEHYLYARNKLNDLLPVYKPTPCIAAPVKKIHVKRADMIRAENIKKKINEWLDVNRVANYDYRAHTKLLFSTRYVEMQAIGFIIEMHHHTGYNASKNIVQTHDLTMSVRRFMRAYDLHESDSLYARDLSYKFDEFVATHPTDGYNVCTDYPELLYTSQYQCVAPIGCQHIRADQPHPHQLRVIESITRHYMDGLLLGYRARIGSGKTTTFPGIAGWVMEKRRQQPQCDLQALFVCNTDIVRTDIARQLWALHIPFGLAVHDDVSGYKIINCRKCGKIASNIIDGQMADYSATVKDKDRIAIIASPEIAVMILREPETFDEYFLFFDEPSIDADTRGCALAHNMRVMHHLPKWTVLASATLPEISMLNFVVDSVISANQSVAIIDVDFDKILISANLRNFEGVIVAPYNLCENSNHIKQRIQALERSHFFKRFCTPRLMFDLSRRLQEVEDVDHNIFPDFRHHLDDVTTITTEVVCQYTVDCLRLLMQQPDQVIGKICANDRLTDTANTAQITSGMMDRFQTFGTTGYQCDGPILIVCNKPVALSQGIFAPLLTKLHEKNIQTLQIVEKYAVLISAYNDICTAHRHKDIRKALIVYETLSGIISRDHHDNDYVKSRPKVVKPLVEFPGCFQIGTSAHKNRFNSLNQYNRIPLVLEDLSLESLNVSEEILALLMCGVGIYSLGCSDLSIQYIDLVKQLAFEGKLAYVVADNSISYGSNHPYRDIYIMDDHFDTHSLETFYQTSGRVGREGKSWKANVLLSNRSIARLFEKIHTGIDTHNEMANMRDAYEHSTD
jgi:hypothetical protein